MSTLSEVFFDTDGVDPQLVQDLFVAMAKAGVQPYEGRCTPTNLIFRCLIHLLEQK